MMKQVITMTINVTTIVSPDLFVTNDSVMFDRQRALQYSPTIPQLGAITFVASKSHACNSIEELVVACAKKATSFVWNALDKEYRTWLFVSDGPWRPATRIARHQRLWKRHRELLDCSGVLRVGQDVEIESTGLIRYAGLLEISGDAFVQAVQLARTNSACAIICSKRPNVDSEASVQSIFFSAFPEVEGSPQVSINWMPLALYLCPQMDIVIRVNGLYDDREAAVDVIAIRGIILSR
jgi:hypothetical protein